MSPTPGASILNSCVSRSSGVVTRVLRQRSNDSAGTGRHIKFGGGYLIDPVTELRATFTFQSLDVDLTPMGDIGTSKLYGLIIILMSRRPWASARSRPSFKTGT